MRAHEGQGYENMPQTVQKRLKTEAKHSSSSRTNSVRVGQINRVRIGQINKSSRVGQSMPDSGPSS